MRRPALRISASTSVASALALALVTAAAAALRLVDLGAVRLDPFYDAAVRSMGVSWHNFFLGAYEPGGSVSIDKPPLDLWLQVLAVKSLGWGSAHLKLPQALAGTAAVPLLYAALRPTFGALRALLAAATLAVLPIEAITARSDTMDAVMMLALVLALFALLRACRTGGWGWLLAGAAAMGLAFNVKLLESLVAAPGLLTIAWLARERLGPARRQAALKLLAAAAVYALVSLSWLLATLAFPAHERPWAIGSTDGSAWNAAFVFNGSERISGKAIEAGPRAGTSAIAPPSPTRLLARSGQLPARWLGYLALLALVLGLPATLAAWRARAAQPLAWAASAGLAVWLLTGLVLFSGMTRLHPRYVEGFTPAVAAMVGLGTGWLAGARGGLGRLALLPVAALLGFSAFVSIQAVEAHTSDAGVVGALHPQTERALSAYLRAHQGAARYELAAGSATSIASLIVQDARPVVMLTTYNGRPFTDPRRLARLVARDEVRYAYLDSTCGPRASPAAAGCAPAARWVRSHGRDVSLAAGLGRRGLLWRLQSAIA